LVLNNEFASGALFLWQHQVEKLGDGRRSSSANANGASFNLDAVKAKIVGSPGFIC